MTSLSLLAFRKVIPEILVSTYKARPQSRLRPTARTVPEPSFIIVDVHRIVAVRGGP